MRNLNELAERIRADGIASGWSPIMIHEWATSNYKVPTLLALIHSEICEAYAETGSDTPDVFLAAELADIQIRTLDLAGGLTTDFSLHVESAAAETGFELCKDRAYSYLQLHQHVTDALEAFRRDYKVKFLNVLGRLYFTVNYMASYYYDIDIDQAIDNKMTINRGRQRRNGGKRV